MTETRVGHCKKDAVDQYVGRGRGNVDMNTAVPGVRGWLGNPYSLDSHSREESIEKFREDFEAKLESDSRFREAVRELAGKTLGCWCRSVDEDGPACHGDVIAEWADRLAKREDWEGDDDDAELYLLKLAESAGGGLDPDHVFEGVEVSDPVAGQMAADPRIDVVEVEKGEFGLDFGTMILDFRVSGDVTGGGFQLQGGLEPTCPDCGAGGERQRRKKGGWVCLDCGERYRTNGEEDDD